MIRKILVSQPKPQSSHNPYAEMASQFGVTFDFRPLTHIEGFDAKEFRQQRIYLEDYTAVLMNSRIAVDQFFRMCQEVRFQVPEKMHYYCNSDSVANYLQKYIQYRKRRVFFAEHNGHFEELLPIMNRRPNEKYMMVASETHTDELINLFAGHGITIRPVKMYRTVSTPWPEKESFDYDMVVLFSAANAVSLRENFPDLKQGDKVIAALGNHTSATLREMGITPDIQVPSPKFHSITEAIQDYLENHQE